MVPLESILASLLKRELDIIASMSWLEELNPADQPRYKVLQAELDIIQSQIIAAKHNTRN